MTELLSYFKFDTTEIVALSVLFILLVIQLFYYLWYYRKPYKQAKKVESDSQPSPAMLKVSVIIVSENEVDSLSENLPAVMEQDFFNYEVIVVNNGSTDESDVLLRSLELRYPNLYHTYLPYSNDKKMDRRKLALTIGIKAAKGDILLFTEPYCKPVSKHWISSMVNELSDDKDVVLGYSFYKECGKFFNRVARFDNYLFNMQRFSTTLNGKPYTGNFRNLLFRRSLFFEHKGFASLLNVEHGELVFISRIMSETNTTVALSQDSFMEADVQDFSLWRQIKQSYFSIRGYLDKTISFLFRFEICTRGLFYLLFVALVAYSVMMQHWAMAVLSVFIFLLRLIVQLIALNRPAKYFFSGKFYFSLLLMDLIQPLYNLRFKGMRFK
ncbi:glycosyltransferase [Dysgonomonas sp. 521]|uniref:glycosyltransferase family 2 protein n=1 Tax=Dysgonomonas sp. 521 TaxID=2302932 RepID=UPI0013CFF958|nr:glycosyltransferase [Dysgonomonas sp. 521]NDV96009.1 glycosyltransferase [Dysgonomonas sp. 521]